MENEIIVCIPGTWQNREEFLKAVVLATGGDFMPAGRILANPKGKDHLEFDFYESDDRMKEAFVSAGQGKITDETLARIAQHKSVVYLYFPFDIVSQKTRFLNFTETLSKCGGIAIKLETSGIAHEWERWFSLLRSDNLFDLYCASVVLVSSQEHYYSCGMHCFNLPESQVPIDFDIQEAADLVNQFNFYQIYDKPTLKSGHTFGLAADSSRFRVELLEDERYPKDDLFYNPNGVWELQRV